MGQRREAAYQQRPPYRAQFLHPGRAEPDREAAPVRPVAAAVLVEQHTPLAPQRGSRGAARRPGRRTVERQPGQRLPVGVRVMHQQGPPDPAHGPPARGGEQGEQQRLAVGLEGGRVG
ncbi:hypothetical protein [Streptomyces sp. ISL-86]|uniref:hypothetical protein n=1 Tax=Streptomyces sp. ISL-86 TaxID=2819187 RepID=UPI001BE7D225|nr:hypothetical protein [Streptomyces sp. ISL-86]MBT2457003.1 hypothetical protein [Streptomyces sp. ISL-86]